MNTAIRPLIEKISAATSPALCQICPITIAPSEPLIATPPVRKSGQDLTFYNF